MQSFDSRRAGLRAPNAESADHTMRFRVYRVEGFRVYRVYRVYRVFRV